QRLHSRAAMWRAVAEKIPFLALAMTVSALTIAAQKSAGAIKLDVPMSIRAANAVVSVSRYLGKLIWPHDLIVFYPYAAASALAILFSVMLLVVASAAAILWRRALPWFFVGWWWFIVSLLPVIG